MKVWGLEPSELQGIVSDVSRSHYNGNLIVKDGITKDGRAYHFTLRVNSSRGKGARLSHGLWGKQRHLVAACWHTHRDVMRALFNYGATRIQTSFADYRGPEDFERKYLATADKNVGNAFNYVAYGNLCECA